MFLSVQRITPLFLFEVFHPELSQLTKTQHVSQ